ncbi:tetratricopeptide repeat protein [Kribbella sp. NBC_01505]|uniref:AfsR/SARP family transcriptional regulator n=1 Tax=Kribbella sp. NBC_01505 TaxID=2903580 RepID=UPI003863BB64
MTDPLRIEILGPLRVLGDGEPVAIGAHRLHTLLAVLALRANQVCTPEELLDLVWHDNPPGTGLKVLPPYIYRLRRVLPDGVLDRTSNGYVLRLPEGALDTADFEAAATQAGRHRKNGDLDAAAAAYRQALGLFRGEPLAGLPGPYLAAQRRRLTERRDKVFADRVDLDLDRGRAAELIAELVPAVDAKPFDERLTGQLVRALAADGRQAEALDLYTRTRQTLIDQLGVEPGPALREIHQTVLRNEEAPRTRDELPYAGAAFIGRANEVAQLTQALSEPGTTLPVVTIDGMAGVGKTALAVHTARQLAHRYPDGLLFVDLHGHTAGQPPRDTKAALDHLLGAVGISARAIPQSLDDARALWRTTATGQRLLVVLDNAADSDAVLPLLPASPTCAVIVTSRNQLTGLGARSRLHLDLLAHADATALLSQLVGDQRSTDDVAASNGLIDRCGRLPLALRIAGARLRHRPTWTVAHINDRLDRVGRRLTELTTDGLGLAAAFELSYQQLPENQQRLFRLLSLLPGRDLDQYGAAALADCPPEEAAALATSLVDANLLLQPTPGRYQFHDLIRDYATALAATDPIDTRNAATDRLLEYYLQASIHPRRFQVGARYFEPGPRPARALPEFTSQDDAVAWVDAEADNLAAAIEHTATVGSPVRTWQLTLAAVGHLYVRGRLQHQERILELALTAAEQLDDREAQARVLYVSGQIIRGRQGSRASADQLQHALDRLPADGDLLLRGNIYSALGHALQTIDPYGAALPAQREATRLGRELEDERLIARSLAYTGMLLTNQFEYEAAIQALVESVTTFHRFGPTGLTADALSALCTCYMRTGELDAAIEAATAAFDLATELQNILSIPFALHSLGIAHRERGERKLAVSIHRQALAAAQTSGMRSAQWTTRQDLGDSLLAAGELDEAGDCFAKVLEEASIDKDVGYMVDAWEGLANHAGATGDPEAAIGYLTQAVQAAEEFYPGRAPSLRAQLDVLTG